MRAESMINDLILTGIPRSGTSYLCSLLHQINNCVAINEPYQMSIDLGKTARLDKILAFHHRMRDDILNNVPIRNKLLRGKMIEDTAVIEQFERYLPSVNRDDFLLCSKNTLGYLARLEGLPIAMPTTPLFACIRHPIDTIASWKQSFSHLKNASFATTHVIGSLEDDHLSDWQKEQVIEISKETRVEYRRAMLWCYLASWIWKNKDTVNIIHYEKTVTHPEQALLDLFSASSSAFSFGLKAPVLASAVRTKKRRLLNDEDRAAIQEICSPIAKTLSYQMDGLVL